MSRKRDCVGGAGDRPKSLLSLSRSCVPRGGIPCLSSMSCSRYQCPSQCRFQTLLISSSAHQSHKAMTTSVDDQRGRIYPGSLSKCSQDEGRPDRRPTCPSNEARMDDREGQPKKRRKKKWMKRSAGDGWGGEGGPWDWEERSGRPERCRH